MSLHLKNLFLSWKSFQFIHIRESVSYFFMSKIKVYCDLTKHIWAKLIRSGLDMDIKHKLTGFSVIIVFRSGLWRHHYNCGCLQNIPSVDAQTFVFVGLKDLRFKSESG